MSDFEGKIDSHFSMILGEGAEENDPLSWGDDGGDFTAHYIEIIIT
jgi:hypothetical protein